MPPSRVLTVSPWDSSTALKARSQGWFLISAESEPEMPLLATMVRPLNAANPATTSWMSARSQVTVMRGACDWAASAACAARYESIDTGVSVALGGATRAAWPPRLGSGAVPATGAGAGGGGGGRVAAQRLDHPPHAARSAPVFYPTLPSRLSIWEALRTSTSITTRTTAGRNSA